MPAKLSFPVRLSISTLLISFTGILVITYTTMTLSNLLLENQLVNKVNADLLRETQSFENNIDQMESELLSIAASDGMKSFIKLEQQRDDIQFASARSVVTLMLKTALKSHETYDQIYYAALSENGTELVKIERNENGVIISDNETLISHNAHTHYQQTIRLKPGEYYVSDIQAATIPDTAQGIKPTISVSTPVFHENGEPAGIIAIHADFSKLTASLRYTSTGTSYILVDHNGQYLYHPQLTKQSVFSSSSNLLNDYPIEEQFNLLINTHIEIIHKTVSEDEQLILRPVYPGKNTPYQKTWALGQLIELNVWQSNDSSIYHALLMAIFTISGLIATFSFLIGSKLSQPIIKLTNIAHRIASGERQIKIVTDRDDELGELAQSIKGMVENLETSESELEKLALSLEEKVAQRTKTIQNRNNAIEASLTGIVIASQKGVISYCNKAFYQTFNYPSLRAALRTNLKELWHDKEKGQQFLESLQENKSWRGEICANTFDGQYMNIEVFAALTINTDGEDELVASFSDITERKKAEVNLKKMSLAIEHSASIVYITDIKGSIEYVNQRFTDVTGYQYDEAIGQKPSLLRSDENDIALYDNLWKTIVSGQEWHGEILNQKKNGELFWNRQSISQIIDDSGVITHFISVGEDVTSIKESHSKIEQMAYYDALTGLPNRRLFKDRLEQALITCQRKYENLALLYLDLDGFKMINDTLGHDTGDLYLKEIANRLKNSIRAEDVVARLGGDEFSIILKDIRDSEAAGNVASKILHRIQQPIDIDGHHLIASASIGITIVPDDGNNIEVLLKNADMAMYKAKDKGKNNWQFFTEEMNRSAMSRLIIEQDLRAAIDKEQFKLFYQPIVRLKTEETYAVEALIRWEHPEKGLISPGAFITVAEETGLIVQIGRWVLKEASGFIQRMREQGFKDIHVAVNLSPRQFQDPLLMDIMDDLYQEQGLSWLELEITEGLLIKDVETSIAKLTQLQRKGATIAIDDFGTGYSSLSYLQQLPIDKLKIDRSFISKLPERSPDRKLAQAIVTMAKGLELKLVAEGIESEQQLKLITSYGCDFGQGYYFSKPVDESTLVDNLSKHLLKDSTVSEAELV